MTKFVRRLTLPERIAITDERYALYALVVETVGRYYWCEMFVLRGRRFKPREFCLLGQRGIVEYAVKKAHQIFVLIALAAAERNETIGWQYGAVMSLRNALHERRNTEIQDPLYHEQMVTSMYRSSHNLKTSYKVGETDARATFDVDGFDRGKTYPWVLTKLATPLEALQIVTKDNPERYQYVDAKD